MSTRLRPRVLFCHWWLLRWPFEKLERFEFTPRWFGGHQLNWRSWRQFSFL